MFKRLHLLVVASLATVLAFVLAVPALAEDTVASSVTSAMTTASGTLTGLISSNAPVIIGVAVALVALSFGIRLVRKMGRG